jgi:hypothetical protein
MKSTIRYGVPLVAGAVLLAFGCTTQTPTATSGPAPAQRSLTSVEESADQPLTEEQAKAVLPARLSVEDAKRLLVQIDPSKLGKPDDKTYSLQARGGHFGHHGFHHFHHFNRFNNFFGFSSFGLGWPWWGSSWLYGWPGYGFYGLGDYYYPYSYYGGYYYPYSYSPYLYGYRSLFWPWRRFW